jgi:hypothetical protein
LLRNTAIEAVRLIRRPSTHHIDGSTADFGLVGGPGGDIAT